MVRVEPHYDGPPHPRELDVFGRPTRTWIMEQVVRNVSTARMQSLLLSKKLNATRNYSWPSPDSWDYSALSKQVKANEIPSREEAISYF